MKENYKQWKSKWMKTRKMKDKDKNNIKYKV